MTLEVAQEVQAARWDDNFQQEFTEAWATAVRQHEYDFPSTLRQFVLSVAQSRDVLKRMVNWPGDKNIAHMLKLADEELDVLDGLEAPELAVILFHEAAFLLNSRKIMAEKE